jgi:hypothetical protein
MAHADDIVIMGRSIHDVKETFTALIEQKSKLGLEINEQKSKFMTVSRIPFQQNKQIEIGTYSFEIVEEFTYLGTCLTSKNEIRPETEKRIATDNRAYYALHPMLKSQSV